MLILVSYSPCVGSYICQLLRNPFMVYTYRNPVQHCHLNNRWRKHPHFAYIYAMSSLRHPGKKFKLKFQINWKTIDCTLRTVGPAKQSELFIRRAPILLPRNWINADSPERPPNGYLRFEQSDGSFHTDLLLRRRIASLARFTRSQELPSPEKSLELFDQNWT